MLSPITDPIFVFTLLLSVVFIAPFLSERLKVPELVVLLIFGAILGQHGFNLLERSSAITLLGSIGLLYIMFIAGLEMEVHRFLQNKNKSLFFGLLTFAIPQTIGMFVGRYYLDFNWPTSILLASMFASHTLIAYPIASKFGIAKRDCVVIAVGGTMITDILALLVLAIIADTAKGVALDWSFWLTLLVGVSLLFSIIWFVLPRIVRYIFWNISEKSSAQFVFVLMVLCLFSYLSHYAKLEPIIGAFLVGMVFNRLIPEQSSLMNRLLFVGNTLFIPFFLVSVGMLINFHVLLTSIHAWNVALAMIACLLITKFLAAWLSGRFFKYQWNEIWVMFGLSVPQAAATLAAVMVGYGLKIFDDNVLNGAIIMILVSCPLGGWVVDFFGRQIAKALPLISEKGVTEQRILVAINTQEYTKKLLDLSFLLYRVTNKTIINPVHIVNESDTLSDSVAIANGEKLLTDCMTIGAGAEIPLSPEIRLNSNLTDGIIRVSKELRSNLILLGWSNRRKFKELFFNKVAGSILETGASRILLCHLPQPINLMQRIFLPLLPLNTQRQDLLIMLREVKHLSNQIAAPMTVYLSTETEYLRAEVEKIKPSAQVNFISIKEWRLIPSTLIKELASSDLVFLPIERRNSAFWHPSLERLPDQILSDYPSNNLLLSYPQKQDENLNLFNDDQSHIDVSDMMYYSYEFKEAIEQEKQVALMVQESFQCAENMAHIIEGLLKSMYSFPLELSEQTVLLHTRYGQDCVQPTLILCESSMPWRFENLKGAYSRVILLITPHELSPGRHLNILSQIARCFMERESATFLASTINNKEILTFLQKKLADNSSS